MLVSPARRPVQTLGAGGCAAGAGPAAIADRRIYHNTVEALFAPIRETSDDVRTLAVVGHDPSIGEFAAVLDDGQCSPAAQRELDAGFPTSGVAVALAETPTACAVQS